MSVPRRLAVAAAVITTLLVSLNIALSVSTANSLYSNSKWVSHTQESLDISARLMAVLLDAETGLRGYLLTKDDRYLEPYNRSLKVVNSRIERLEMHTADNLLQNELVLSIRRDVDLKVAKMKETLEVGQRDGVDAAVQIMLQDEGRQLMERIRDKLIDFRQMETRLLAERSSSTSTALRTAIVTAISSGFAVLVFAVLHLSLTSRYQRSLRTQADLIRVKSDMLQTTLRCIGDGVITTDLNGDVTDINPVAQELTGWVLSDAVGKPLAEVFNIIDEKLRHPVESPVVRALRTGRIVGLANHTLLIRRDGSELPIDDSAAPIIEPDGRVSGCILVFHDVSKKRSSEIQLEADEKTFRVLFDLAPIGMVHLDLDGRIMRVNQKFCDIVKMASEELKQGTFTDITHTDDLDRSIRAVKSMVNGEIDSFSMDKRYINPSGDVVWGNVTASLLRDDFGHGLSIIEAVVDITERRRTEEFKQRMSAIVNASNDAIITKDLNGTVTSWNPAAERLFGFSESEMLGTSVLKVIPEDKHSEEMELLQRLRTGESLEPYRTMRLHRDGRPIAVYLSAASLLDADGLSLGVCTVVKDLTAEMLAAMELKESESRFRMLADNMSQFAWMADSDGKVYWFNKRWYDFTGTTLEEMEGQGWHSVLHPDHVDRVVQSLQHSWNTGDPWEETFPIRGKDGNYEWFLSRALPIRDIQGNIKHWFGSNTDITELVENQKSLQKARMVAELASQARGEFLANMSHEIRTPMTAILGHAEILAEHIANPDDLQSVDTIRRNGKFLLQIINDILDLSKIDSGKFEIEPQSISPSDILVEIRSLLDVRASEKQLQFDVQLEGKVPKVIQTDPVRLRQILVNLVGNAIKFTDRGTVSVVCSYQPETNNVRFDVIDTGIGIDKEDLPHIFNPFVQADASSTRAFEGTGLGLAISKRLANALGGDIQVESAPGQGSTFSLEIDCGKLSNSDWLTSIVTIPSETRKERIAKIDGTILVVDDRRDIRFLAQNFLEKAGAKVVFATNGQEAIDFLQSQGRRPQVDAVLMDMQMPVMDGYTAAKTLREQGFKKPIIALTANAMKDDRAKCLASGCDDYAAKPLDGPSLVHVLALHIARSRSSLDPT